MYPVSSRVSTTLPVSDTTGLNGILNMRSSSKRNSTFSGETSTSPINRTFDLLPTKSRCVPFIHCRWFVNGSSKITCHKELSFQYIVFDYIFQRSVRQIQFGGAFCVSGSREKHQGGRSGRAGYHNLMEEGPPRHILLLRSCGSE